MARPEYMILTTRQGDVKGLKQTTIYNEEFYSFEGIPYAKPPIGPLRFKAPEPAENWSGVRTCFEAGSPPVQMDWHTRTLHGSEDCLYLNVYVKSFNSLEKLPVMVWIYGGSFTTGYANRDRINPDYLMWKDVVFVTFNYRVGSLGFLAMKDPSLGVPGNAGLKDIVLALKWVKENIDSYNGDPNNITIFGESAGGAAVHFMMTTDKAKGLFHKAIMQSGAILNPWAYIPIDNMPYRLAVIKGYKGDQDEKNVLEFLNRLEPSKLVDSPIVTDEDRDKGILYAFAPTIEPYDSDQCIISIPYVEALHKAWGNSIPLIIGGTSFEGMVVYARMKQQPWKASLFFDDPKSLLPNSVLETSTPQEIKSMTRTMLKTHLGEEKLGPETMLQLLDIFSIRYFWLGIHQSVQSRILLASAPTYLYRFDFDSPSFGFRRNMYTDGDIKQGVAHADDLQYLFHYRLAPKLDENTPEYKTIRRMIGMWTEFAARSNPNCSEMEGITWEPVDKEKSFSSLNIGYELVQQDLPEKDKILIWNSFL